jgi:hypothetical protein
MLYKIWDNRFQYYCLTVYTRKQAEIIVEHFMDVDSFYNENMKNRYRIDEVPN